MANATYISDLNPNRPLGSQLVSTSDESHREVRRVLRNTFPNLVGSTNVTADQLNLLIDATNAIQASVLVRRNSSGHLEGDLEGNADSATILSTARNIAGQSFDGSSDIEIGINDLSSISGLTATDINRLVGLAASLGTDTLVAGLESIRDDIPTAATQESSSNRTNFVTPALLDSAITSALSFLSALQNLGTSPNTRGLTINRDGTLSVVPVFGSVSGVGTSTITLPANYSSDFDVLFYTILQGNNASSLRNTTGTILTPSLGSITQWQTDTFTFTWNETNRTISIRNPGNGDQFQAANLRKFA